MAKGLLHSIETYGLVDGTELHYVLYAQKCLFRCQYCHNPETWGINGGQELSVEEVMKDILNYQSYFEENGGGVTVSGGEPLLQIDFLTELFKVCKKHKIRTTLCSSGAPFSRSEWFLNKMEELLQYTDLVLLDIKHIDNEKHKILTGVENKNVLEFAHYLSDKCVPVWIRHVLIPTINDFDEDLEKLSEFIKTLSNVKKIEVIPYHEQGIYRWKAVGLEYQLNNVSPPSTERIENAKRILNKALNKTT